MADRTTFWRTASWTLLVLLSLDRVAHSSVGEQAFDELSQRHKLAQLEFDGPPQTNSGMNESPPVKEDSQPALPNGVDALKESFGDWAVECKIIGAARKCSMGQYQQDKETGRMVIAIAISPTENGSTKIMILMPLGLELAEGIRLKLDNWSTARTAQFATCISDGCLVPIAFSDASMEALMQAKTLAITATVNGSHASPAFNISLKGFAAAYARLMSLR